MEFYHTKCGGRIDTKTRTCLRCKKHWNWFSFKFTLTEIRPIPVAEQRKVTTRALRAKKVQPVGWGDKIPGVGEIAGLLPNWPRWARILSTLVFVGVVIAVILLVVK